MNISNLFQSKRFWVAVAGLVIVFVREQIPFLNSVSEESITNGVLVIAAWIVGDSLRAVPPKVAS